MLAALLVALVAAVAAGGALAAVTPQYTVVDLGTHEGRDWVNVNDRGELTGELGSPFSQAAVRRPNGSIVTFPAFAPYNRSTATATNNLGATVGFSAFQTMFGATGAVWDSGGTTILGDLMLPLDVNDAGQVVGVRAGAAGAPSFLWQAGASRDLRFGSATFVRADAVNERGQVAGRGQDLFGIWPLFWEAGATEALRLGRHVSSSGNTANDINDDGVVVGRLQFGSSLVATKWVGGVLQHLPTLSGVDGRSGFANAINNRNQIVGMTEELVPGDLGQVAALWTEDGVVDLNSVADVPPGFVLIEAIDINDRGQIIAEAHQPATYSGGRCCGEWFFLLTPVECGPIAEEDLASGDAGEGLPDGDGDGIPDCWEEDGIPVETEDGDLVTYLLPGADPERKDLYLEVDHMVGFAPEPGAIEDVVAAFAAAPVGNPDGSSGITLHVEVDDEVPHTPGLVFAQDSSAAGDFWSLKSGGPAPCDGFFGSGPERSGELCRIKLGAKRLVYRYGIFADTFGSADNEGSGIAECGTALTIGCAGAPGNDFLVTIGHHWDETDLAEMGGRRAMEAGAFMHEFGHTLGLDHGGGDIVNCKPNYVSAMNYSYVLVPTEVSAVRLLDYSRWASTLDEAQLDEAAGVGGPAGQVVFGWMGLWLSEPGAGGVDWNRDGMLGQASANVNWIQLIDLCRRPDGLPPSKVDGNGIVLETLETQAVIYDGSSVPAPSAFEAIVCRPAPGNSHDCESVVPLRVAIRHGRVLLTLPVTVAPVDFVRARYHQPDENPLLKVFETGFVKPEDDNTEWNLQNITHRRETLHGFNDWANLKYNVRDAQGFADLAGASRHEPEITFAEVRAVAQDLLEQLDNDPPDVTASATPAPNAAGWNRGPVTVTFAATYDGSGVKEIVYNLGTGLVTVAGDDAQVTIGGDGVTTVTYFARDVRGNASAPKTLVVRIDGTAPAVGCRVSPAKLWPPNHKLVDVSATVTVSDTLSGSSGYVLVSAMSSEPDNGLGDGDTANDIQGWESGTADVAGKLRAERSGKGNGRVYSLRYEAIDRAGNVGRCTATVLVPRNG